MLAGRAAGLLAERVRRRSRRPASRSAATNEGMRVRRNGAGIAAGRYHDRALPRLSDRSAGAVHGADDAGRGHVAKSARRSSRTASCTCRSSRGSAPTFGSTGRSATVDGVDQAHRRAGHGDRPAGVGLARHRGACGGGRDDGATASTISTAASRLSRRSCPPAARRSSDCRDEPIRHSPDCLPPQFFLYCRTCDRNFLRT